MFTKLRGPMPKEKLKRPNPCAEDAPDTINVYSDGSLKYGAKPVWALGAAGLWWPKRTGRHISVAECEISHWEPGPDGLRMYTALPGFGGSFTRTELAAGILALAADDAVHIGTDSQSFLHKALYVLQFCKEGRAPKRPWGTHKDGDLWRVFHEFAKQRGHASIRLSKVQGRATQKQVDEGKVKNEDRRGNDEADETAKKGNKMHGEGLVKVAGWMFERHRRYTAFIKDIHNHIIEGCKIRKEVSEAKEAARCKEFGGTERKIEKEDIFVAKKEQQNQQAVWESIKGHIKEEEEEQQEEESELSLNIKRFLTRLQVAKPEDGEVGATWIELHTLYKSMGYPFAVQQSGSKANARPNLRKQLYTFKLQARRIARKLPEDSSELFKPGKKRGYALKRLGIENHFATVNLKVNLQEEDQRHLDKELLRAKGSKLKDLELQSRGRKPVKVEALSLKHKVNWSKGVKKFPEKSLKSWPEKELPEVYKDWRRGVKRKPEPQNLKPRSVKAPLPEGDEVKVVRAVAGQKRQCSVQPAFKLRAGMLSARLRERFGHLCTEEDA